MGEARRKQQAIERAKAGDPAAVRGVALATIGGRAAAMDIPRAFMDTVEKRLTVRVPEHLTRTIRDMELEAMAAAGDAVRLAAINAKKAAAQLQIERLRRRQVDYALVARDAFDSMLAEPGGAQQPIEVLCKRFGGWFAIARTEQIRKSEKVEIPPHGPEFMSDPGPTGKRPNLPCVECGQTWQVNARDPMHPRAVGRCPVYGPVGEMRCWCCAFDAGLTA